MRTYHKVPLSPHPLPFHPSLPKTNEAVFSGAGPKRCTRCDATPRPQREASKACLSLSSSLSLSFSLFSFSLSSLSPPFLPPSHLYPDPPTFRVSGSAFMRVGNKHPAYGPRETLAGTKSVSLSFFLPAVPTECFFFLSLSPFSPYPLTPSSPFARCRPRTTTRSRRISDSACPERPVLDPYSRPVLATRTHRCHRSALEKERHRQPPLCPTVLVCSHISNIKYIFDPKIISIMPQKMLLRYGASTTNADILRFF